MIELFNLLVGDVVEEMEQQEEDNGGNQQKNSGVLAERDKAEKTAEEQEY